MLLLTAAVAGCVGAPKPASIEPTAAAPAPRLLLVSVDGMRWDFLDRYPTPNFDRVAAAGVRAERLIPSFPSKTFPNHYTIVTGLYPGTHGLVANNMYDPVFEARYSLGQRDEVANGRWYGGEPLWVTAERQGMRTAPLFWPGAEAEIGGVRPTYWMRFDDDLPIAERVTTVLDWMGSGGARFATFYLSDVDGAAHHYNPDTAPEVGEAVAKADRALGLLLDGLEARGLGATHVIVVSDHGMVATSPERLIAIDDFVDVERANVIDWSPVLALWPSDEDLDDVYTALLGAHPRLAVYRREEVPERFHYREHRRIPPIIGIAEAGWSISTSAYVERHPERFAGGNHGYDNRLPVMGAVFLAAGPGIRRAGAVGPLENIHLYELMCHLLGLEPAANEGRLEAVEHLLAAAPG